MKLPAFLILLAGVLLNALAQLELKAATRSVGAIRLEWSSLSQAVPRVGGTAAFWVAMCAYGLSVLVWIVGLSRVPVSQAYPLLSLGYVVAAIAAWAWLNEPLSVLRLCGIALIIGGVYLVARS